mgnify:CR=1 FL=1
MLQDTNAKENEKKFLRPRAWCIRIPRTYCGDLGHKNIGGFQTVVIAYDQVHAWESAMGASDWEMLAFPVNCVSVKSLKRFAELEANKADTMPSNKI